MLIEMVALLWDSNAPYLYYQNNDTALFVLSANSVSGDDDFLTKSTSKNPRFHISRMKLKPARKVID
jgi:hypothetical protein